MTWMFNDNFKVNNDSFATLVNSDFSNETGNFSLNTHVKVVFVLEMTDVQALCMHAELCSKIV